MMAEIVNMLLLIVPIFAIMYFLIILPQRRERERHESFLASLAKDDCIVTSGGVWAKVLSVDEATVMVEIGDRTRVRLDKGAIARRQSEPVEKK